MSLSTAFNITSNMITDLIQECKFLSLAQSKSLISDRCDWVESKLKDHGIANSRAPLLVVGIYNIKARSHADLMQKLCQCNKIAEQSAIELVGL